MKAVKKLLICSLALTLIAASMLLGGCDAVEIRSSDSLKDDINGASLSATLLPTGVTDIQNDFFAKDLKATGGKVLQKSENGALTSLRCELTFENEILSVTGQYTLDYSIAGDVWELQACGPVPEVVPEVTLTITSRIDSVDIEAYKGNSDITALVIEDGVAEMRDAAFMDCVNLRTVTIGGDITYFAPDCFRNCTALESVTVNGESMAAFLSGSFYGCTSLKTINFTKNVSFIGSDVFNGCTSLKNPVFNEGLQFIKTNAFYGCTSITAITIPATLELLENGAFDGCTSLGKLKVASGNPYFEVKGKQLIDTLSNEVVIDISK